MTEQLSLSSIAKLISVKCVTVFKPEACFKRTEASLVVQRLKCLPAMWETWVRSLGQEDPLEKEMATHSSILAWRIHGRRSLVGYSPRVAKSRT